MKDPEWHQEFGYYRATMGNGPTRRLVITSVKDTLPNVELKTDIMKWMKHYKKIHVIVTGTKRKKLLQNLGFEQIAHMPEHHFYTWTWNRNEGKK